MADNSEAAFGFDFSTLTIDEIEQFEDHLGVSFDQMEDALADGRLRLTKVTRVVGWLLKRRLDPTFTLEQAGSLTMAEITSIGAALGGDDHPEA